MFLVTLEVLFSIFVISLLIYLSTLKERFPEFTQAGWNKLTSGLIFVLLAGITGILAKLPIGPTLFSSVGVSSFLQIAFLGLGLAWIFWGLSGWLRLVQKRKEELGAKETELAFLYSAIENSKRGNTLIEILDGCLRGITPHFKTDKAALWIINPASQKLILASFRGLSPNLAKSLENLDLQAGIPKLVSSGELYHCNVIEPGSDHFLHLLSKEGIQSALCVPLMASSNRIGMVALLSEQKYKFDPGAISLLQQAVSYVTDRIEFLRLTREIQKKTETLNQSIAENRILSVVSGYLTSDLGLEPILDRIIWEGLKVIEASSGHIFLLEGENAEVKATLDPAMVHSRGRVDEYPLISRVVSSRNAVTEKSHLLVPIFIQGKIAGILWYENQDNPRVFTAKEIAPAKTLANQASLAIANWQLQHSATEALGRVTELREKLEQFQAKYDELASRQPEPVPDTKLLLASQVNDINNLLAGVLGNLELLQERMETGQLPYHQTLVQGLKSIEKTTLEAASLVKQFTQGEVVEIPAEKKEVKVVAVEEEKLPFRGLKILAIDDQKMILDLLSSMLSALGHTTELALTGQEGLEKFRQDAFDLVITDLGMPDISGFEVSQKIKAMKPDIPVVMITGWGANFEESQLKEAGVDYLLAKPFRLEQLIEVVDKIIQPKTSNK